MGYFSWLAADTKKSIANVDTPYCRPVYMLQPNGKPALREEAYEGYGEFAGVNAHQWLAEMNVPNPEQYTPEELRIIGISLELGDVLVDTETQQSWCIMSGKLAAVIGAKDFSGNWDTEMPDYGQSPNALVKEGRLVRKPVSQVYPLRYPLKFSFNPHARYDELPASEQCPDQGYFYEEEDEYAW